MMVFCENIRKKYGELEVLKGVSLEINQGEIAAILGASGAGKSTLLQILGTLDQADSGEVKLNNISLNKLKKSELAKFRNQEIGFVFQSHQLILELNAMENLMLPGMIAQTSSSKMQERTKELLSYLGLENRASHFPSQLSGGEQQRIAIGRALFNQPKVIFADEPTGNLDSANAEHVQELFLRLKSDFQQTFVVVTHNQSMAQIANRVFTMKDGVLV